MAKAPEVYTHVRAKTDKLDKDLRAAADKFGFFGNTLKGIVTKFAGVFTIGTVAVKAFQGILNSTQTTQDKFASAQLQAKEATQSFFRSIAEGDWTNLITRMDEAVASGKEYFEIIDRLGDLQRSLNVQEAESQKRLAQLRIAYMNQTLSTDERTKAAKEYIQIQEQLSVKSRQYAEEELAALLNKLSITNRVDKERLVGYIREYENWDNLISKGTEYNEALANQEFWFKQIANGAYGASQKYDEASAKLAELGSEGELAGKIALEFGSLTEEQMEAIKAALIKVANADASYYQNTIRASSILNGLLQKNTKELNSQVKSFELLKQGGDYPAAWKAPLEKPSEGLSAEDINFDYEGATGGEFYNFGTLGFYQTLLQNYQDQLLDLEITSEEYAKTQEKIIALQEKLGTTTDTTADAFAGLASQLTSIWGSAIEDTEDYREAMKQTVKAVVQMLVAEGIAHIIKNTLKVQGEQVGAWAVPIAAGAGIAAGALFDAAVPEFAAGGFVPGSSYAGDRVPAMLNSGEAVLNAQQQKNFMALANGSRQKLEVTGILRADGKDLVAVIDSMNKYYSIVR
jgi:hypothetical protein